MLAHVWTPQGVKVQKPVETGTKGFGTLKLDHLFWGTHTRDISVNDWVATTDKT